MHDRRAQHEFQGIRQARDSTDGTQIPLVDRDPRADGAERQEEVFPWRYVASVFWRKLRLCLGTLPQADAALPRVDGM